jgi:hypothetical protein
MFEFATLAALAVACILGLKVLLMAAGVSIIGATGVMNVPAFPDSEGGLDDLHLVAVTPGTAITLPVGGLHLVAVQLTGGAAAGAVTLSYGGGPIAHFPVQKSGYSEWLVDWQIPKGGTTIAAALTATEGTAPAQVIFVFATTAIPGSPSIDWYRAIFFTAAPAGANTVAVAYSAGTYDQGPACPTGVLAVTSAGNASFLWPVVGTTQGGWYAAEATSLAMFAIRPAPRGIKSANTLTPSYLNSAAATLSAWVFYKPMPSGTKL